MQVTLYNYLFLSQKSEEEVPPNDIIPQDAASQGGGVFWAGP